MESLSQTAYVHMVTTATARVSPSLSHSHTNTYPSKVCYCQRQTHIPSYHVHWSHHQQSNTNRKINNLVKQILRQEQSIFSLRLTSHCLSFKADLKHVIFLCGEGKLALLGLFLWVQNVTLGICDLQNKWKCYESYKQWMKYNYM